MTGDGMSLSDAPLYFLSCLLSLALVCLSVLIVLAFQVAAHRALLRRVERSVSPDPCRCGDLAFHEGDCSFFWDVA